MEGDQALAADALFDQIYVDKTRLMAQIRRALQTRHQISLADLVKSFPLEQGLAELVAYLSLATEDDAAVIDDTQQAGTLLGGCARARGARPRCRW